MRRTSPILLSRLLAAPCVLLSLFAGFASAQTVRVGDAAAGPGSTVAIPITFEAGENPVDTYQLRVTYDGTLYGTPTIAPNPVGLCDVNDATGVVSVLRFSFTPQALTDETACTVLFPIEVTTAAGVYPLPISDAGFVDQLGEPVDGTFDPGSISVVPGSGVAPQLAYIPVFDADGNADNSAEVLMLPEVIGVQAAAEIVIAAVGGEGAASVDLACSVPVGVTITGGATQTLNPGAIPSPVVLSCTPVATPIRRQLVCTETDTPGGALRQRSWDVLCAGPIFNSTFE
jgi:hypothetical protein